MAAGLALALAGCSSTLSDMESLVSTPAGAPAPPETPPLYPAVHDLPAPRPALLTAEEQERLERDLVATRDGRSGRGEVTAGAAKKTSKKPPQKPVGEAAADSPLGD